MITAGSRRKSESAILMIFIILAAVFAWEDQAAAAPAYKYGRNLTIGAGPVISLDPQRAVDPNSRLVIANLYDRLYQLDKKGKLVLVLAAALPLQQGPLKYIIRLREGVRFHDQSLFDAEDVVYSFTRLTRIRSPFRQRVEGIKGIEYLDQYRVLVRLNRPVVNLAAIFAQLEMAPLSKSFVERYGDDYGLVSACGTGPFHFYSWKHGKIIILKKNFGYWQPGLPYLDRLVFKEFQEDQAVAALKKRSISVAVNLSPKQAGELDNSPKTVVRQAGENRLIQLYLNARSPELETSPVRQALSLAIDRQQIVDEVFGGYAQVARCVFPPGGLLPEMDTPLYPFDQKAAESKLTQAGYRKETPLELVLFCSSDFILRKIGEVIKKQLAKVGVELTVREMDKQQIFDYIYERRGKKQSRFKIGLEDWQGDYDPESFLFFPYSSHSPFNKLLKHDQEVDYLLEEAGATQNNNLKQELIIRFAGRLAELMQTIPLCFPKRIFAYNDYVSKLYMDRSGVISFLHAWTQK